MEQKKLKIVTYNIHKGFGVANFRFVLHKIRTELEKINPDLVFLQEIQGEHAKREERVDEWPDKAQFEFLAENNWEHFIYGKNATHKHGHHGNAILSKFDFLEWENINVAKYKRSSRSLLHATLNIPGITKEVHIICVHFALLKSERAKQLEQLEARIIEQVPADAAVIVAGDFNDWRKHAEGYLEGELGFKEAYKTIYGEYAKTFPAVKPKLTVDRIYYRNINLRTCERLDGQAWRFLSDHVPLGAEFMI